MSELQRLVFEADGQTYDIYIDSSVTSVSPTSEVQGRGREEYGIRDNAVVSMQQARQMIRGYAMYAISAFKDFGAAEIEEVTLKFGMKLGGSAGIPYITEGKAESNLEIEVKCKFSDKSKLGSPPPNSVS
ncbi:CU044_2847 family protein [Coleofasciculus sp. H7-2]|uniref:CU044_2847 family protein n=1 Tax=Coleofasciculus sp. H7-2 TaxID=3351545 RepID=UPI00366C49DB